MTPTISTGLGAVLAAWLVSVATATEGASFSWDGDAGDSRWSSVSNWLPDASAPEPDGDDAVLNPSPEGGISTNDVERAVQALTVQLGRNTAVDLGGVRLSVTNITVAQSTSSGAASLLFCEGSLDVSGTLLMARNPTTSSTPNATLSLSNVVARIGTLQSNSRYGNGTITVHGGRVTLADAATIGYGEVGSGSRKGTMTLLESAQLVFGEGGGQPDIDVGRAAYRGGVGTLDASQGSVTGRIATLDIGISTGGNGGAGVGTTILGPGTVDIGVLRMGHTELANAVHCVGLLELTGTSVTVSNCFINIRNGSGTLAMQGGSLRITDYLEAGRGVHGLSFTPWGRVIASGHAEVAFGRPGGEQADVVVGWASYRSGTGTLDLRGASTSGYVGRFTVGRSSSAANPGTGTGVGLLGPGSLDVQTLTLGEFISGGSAAGTLDLNATVVVCSNVTVSAGGGAGSLHLQNGARLCVSGALTVAANGVSSNSVALRPGGFDLAEDATLTLATPHRIRFFDPAGSFEGIYWGLRWRGSHSNALATTYAGKIIPDASSLSPRYGTPGIFERAGFTYIGVHVPATGLQLLVR